MKDTTLPYHLVDLRLVWVSPNMHLASEEDHFCTASHAELKWLIVVLPSSCPDPVCARGLPTTRSYWSLSKASIEGLMIYKRLAQSLRSRTTQKTSPIIDIKNLRASSFLHWSKFRFTVLLRANAIQQLRRNFVIIIFYIFVTNPQSHILYQQIPIY